MHRNNIAPKRPLAGLIAALALLAAPMADAMADTTAYYLDQSQQNVSVLPDGTNYLKLVITSNVAGTASFDLSTVFALTQGANYGLQAFAFNYSGSAAPSSMVFTDLPTGWAVNPPPPSRFDGYGDFDFIVGGRGQDRVSSLSFTISGLGGATAAQTLSYFAKASSGNNAGEGKFYFGGHLSDFTANNVAISSVQFAGSTVAAVPEPESYAMLLAGLGFIGALARRRRIG